MSRSRFLADHDLNEHIVTGIVRRAPALECVRVRDIGMSERSDAGVFWRQSTYIFSTLYPGS